MGHRAAQAWVPKEYQVTAGKFLAANTVGQGAEGGAALLLDPGMGKTSICLSFFNAMKMLGVFHKGLVIAPRRVCQKVWPEEVKDWTDFHGLRLSLVTGTAEARRRKLATPADLYVISRDNLDWLARLVKYNKNELPWQVVFFDESTSFKTWSATRSKAAREISARIPYRIIMTGTPSPKDLGDLFPQIFLLDHGKSLGKNVTEFRNRYCVQVGEKKFGRFDVRADMTSAIRKAIEPLCLRLNIQDYLSMPEITYHDVWVDLPDDVRSLYREMEKMLFVALQESQRDISCAAALYGACKQIANGGIYDNQRAMHHLHGEKIEAAMEIIDELNGKPAIIAYQFEHDAERLAQRIKGLTIIRGGLKDKQFSQIIDKWNNGTLKPQHLAVQPAAMSYGINMQHGEGRDIIWLGLTDSLEIYQQLNARLWRQGVTSQVRIHRVLATDTVDTMNAARIDERFDVQANLLAALQAYAQETWAVQHQSGVQIPPSVPRLPAGLDLASILPL